MPRAAAHKRWPEASRPRVRKGNESTHWSTGAWGGGWVVLARRPVPLSDHDRGAGRRDSRAGWFPDPLTCKASRSTSAIQLVNAP